MYTILMLNQKGGVGKTTIADELAFALERKNKSVCYISLDPQGGSVHEETENLNQDFCIVDSPGSLSEEVRTWCKNSDLILIPTLASKKDLEPTFRSYKIAEEVAKKNKIKLIVNNHNERGILDRQIISDFTDSGYDIIAIIPKTVSLIKAGMLEMGIKEFDKNSVVIEVFDNLANYIINDNTNERS